VAATPDRATNEQIFRDATGLSILVNVVDTPHLCTFIFPSIVDRDPLLIAISSSGRSPVLARILRRQIEALWCQRPMGDWRHSPDAFANW
jgi:uroporphyrin-III C-methyltransferase / precorrin-2 dehydrogenase / sirohydrochlorin ferrochelatase